MAIQFLTYFISRKQGHYVEGKSPGSPDVVRLLTPVWWSNGFTEQRCS